MNGRVVPVLTAESADDAERACEAILAGGLTSVEVTFRTEAAAGAIRRASQIDGLVVGAGTVLTEAQLTAALDAGARFAVAPSTNESVVRAAQAAGIEFVPGAATATEIDRARALGCRVVKIFPASLLGGPAFVKAMTAVFPDVRFVPTGGVSADNLGDYLALPSVLACGGTWICEPALLRDGRFAEIERRARDAARVPGVNLRPREECRFDLVALGEVMLRFDPGDGRIATTRSFAVSEGGGEYNVARGLRRCFGLCTAIVTAFADNPVGRLLEDLVMQGGVDQTYVRWMPYDGIGRGPRNGLNFVERGFGVRAALGCSDRGRSAASELRPGDVDWDRIFGCDGARWFHCGGIFAALSEGAAEVALEAMAAAQRHGTVVSYDLNYRPSLWNDRGGPAAAASTNSLLVGLVDVLLGNEEDLSAALGVELEGVEESHTDLDVDAYERLHAHVLADYPNLAIVATSLRQAPSATVNNWSGVCSTRERFVVGPRMQDLDIFDRVGGGDSFASGLIYGLLEERDLETALAYGVAHGALAMTTPGDTSMASLAEVQHVARGGAARIVR